MTTNQPLRKRRNELDGRRGIEVSAYQNPYFSVTSPATSTVPFASTTEVVDTVHALTQLTAPDRTRFTSLKFSYYKVRFIVEFSATGVIDTDVSLSGIYDTFGGIIPSLTIPLHVTVTTTIKRNGVALPNNEVITQIGSFGALFTYGENSPLNLVPYYSDIQGQYQINAISETIILLETGDYLDFESTYDFSTNSAVYGKIAHPGSPVLLAHINAAADGHIEISEFSRGL